MELEQLNIKANAYYSNRCDDTLRELYGEAVKVFRRWHRTQTRALRKGDEHDADTYFDNTFMRLCKREGIRDFGRTFSSALKVERLKIGRDNERRQRRHILSLDAPKENNEGDSYAVEFSDDISAEDAYLDRKKETDQRQLTDFLAHSGRPDPLTISLVEAYRTAPLGTSDTAIAKSIGIHHETAKRLLLKLSQHYDANRFGDVRDYLAV